MHICTRNAHGCMLHIIYTSIYIYENEGKEVERKINEK